MVETGDFFITLHHGSHEHKMSAVCFPALDASVCLRAVKPEWDLTELTPTFIISPLSAQNSMKVYLLDFTSYGSN